jgi:hypothetical protein
MSRWEFIHHASQLGIPYFAMTADEWEAERKRSKRCDRASGCLKLKSPHRADGIGHLDLLKNLFAAIGSTCRCSETISVVYAGGLSDFFNTTYRSSHSARFTGTEKVKR